MAIADAVSDTDLDVDAWLDENWSPDRSVGDWWRALADARLAHPMLPEPWGRNWSRCSIARRSVRHPASG